MNKWLLGLSICITIFLCSCGASTDKNNKTIKLTQRDISITPKNSFTDQFLDSAQLEHFIVQEKIDNATAQEMRSFYNSRNYQFAWFNKDAVNEPGLAFWNLLNNYISISKDSSLFNNDLAKSMGKFTEGDSLKHIDQNTITQTELGLTRQFFIYAKVAYAGKINPQELQWFIPRKKVDALALLDSLVARKGKAIEQWEPLNPQYQALKKALIRYNEIADKGGWNTLSLGDKRKYELGDKGKFILDLKQRLYASGDLTSLDSSNVFDSSLVQTVKKVQHSFGLSEDGVVGKGFIAAVNVSVQQRIEQILVNMERMKWLPEKPAPNRIVANIPEFKLHVYDNDTEAFEMNIVVGKEGHNTVIFNNELKYIVFSPYWNVPSSIVKKEILPALRRNPNYLAKHHMEKTGMRGGLPVIRQKPGGSNSLGRVKFLFPNEYNIYLHDTPAKSLFNNDKRAFSHGCVRLANAEKLANYLLRNQPEWTPERIDSCMHLTKEKWVTLTPQVPVFISYFTAWVDQNGVLNFRNDIYGHDAKMAERLFVHPLIIDTVKQVDDVEKY